MSDPDDLQSENERPFLLWGYLALNAAVWALSLGFYLAVKWLVGDTTGIAFFSVILPLGFGGVSILDAVYDRTRGAATPNVSSEATDSSTV